MRSSHGCMRFYPEDIALLFDQIPVGTPVHVVNQPMLIGWHDGAIYLQTMPVMEDDTRPAPEAAGALLNAAISGPLWQKAQLKGQPHAVAVDLEMVAKIAKEQRGIALPVSKRNVTPEQYLASAPRVHNRIPQGGTWDGREELLVTAEEYEAVRAGKPLPKKSPSKSKSVKGANNVAPGTNGGGTKATGSR